MWNAKKSATKNVYYSTLKFYTYKTLTIVLVVHIWYTPMIWVIEEREMRPFIVKYGLLYAWFYVKCCKDCPELTAACLKISSFMYKIKIIYLFVELLVEYYR